MCGSGCIGQHGDAPSESLPPGEMHEEGLSLQSALESASKRHGVPFEVLAALAWTETRGLSLGHGHAHHGRPEAYGPMALRGKSLEQAASLAGYDPESVRQRLVPNVEAAAALLAFYGRQEGIAFDDRAAWPNPIVRYCELEDLQAQAQYIHEGIYRTMAAGVSSEVLRLPPTEVTPLFPLPNGVGSPGPDYNESIWRPSSNHSARPAGASGKPKIVIIHTCEGSYTGCWSWLKKSGTGVSAHYVVNDDGSEISQLVRESRKAWHISAKYKSALNEGNYSQLTGTGSNNFTLGVEHAGYGSQSSWSEGLLDASAKLVCAITKKHNIPRDKYHIVGHGQLQPYNRSDPGKQWPWNDYLARIAGHCNEPNPQPPPPPSIDPEQPPAPGENGWQLVIDSNNAKNSNEALCKVSSNWNSSNSVVGYFNTGYWWRTTGGTADAAEFRAYLTQERIVRVSMWWAAAQDRATSVPVVIHDGEGQHLATHYVNQQKTGGQWVELGVHTFRPGWNSVAVSRWTDSGKVVVADAVRLDQVADTN